MENYTDCNKCDYKSSIAKNLNDLKKFKHPVEVIPCDICDYVAKSLQDYDKHAKSKHGAEDEHTKSNKSKKKETNKKDSNKTKETQVKIPCDLCEFTSVSAEDFINHIETNHQKHSKGSKTEQYACGKCDYKSHQEIYFKKHLEVEHKLNVGGWKTVNKTNRPIKPCVYWNQGNCKKDNCTFEHEEIAACVFKERCSRSDCKFWHESFTGKYPFLGFRHSNRSPNLPRRN